MKCGKAKRLPDQHKEMHNFFHGVKPTHPPQIKLLADAHVNYRDMFDEIVVSSTTKDDDLSTVKQYSLSKRLTQDISRLYYSGVDLRHEDLEKRTGQEMH